MHGEICKVKDFVEYKTEEAVRAKKLFKRQGKEYKMQENDNDDQALNCSDKCRPGQHVFVGADMFDSDDSHYLRSVGLGPAVDTDPSAKTVFLSM